ncbi:MAG TPA: ATP-dependent DNA ligase [Microthrixaceae bacterium]|nr:ATP-dependent DNA ligase [Microthrixaceae bacterium]
MKLPVMPPLKPMLSKASRELPAEGMLYEPKWDGFRCIVFRDGDEVELGSRNERPLTRYFPELIDPIKKQLPRRCVLDAELVVATESGLDFDVLGQRIHPAESRIRTLSEATPASLVVFDILALDDIDLRPLPFSERRGTIEQLLSDVHSPIHLTPATTDPTVAQDWFERFEGSGFDGVMAKPLDGPYVSDKRVQLKLKHHRTADCVVAGYRLHKEDGVGSLLLGLYDDKGRLHHVGVCSAFSASQRRTLAAELAPYEDDALDGHPWHDWADPLAHEAGVRMPGAPSRWSGGKSSEWIPLRCELVAEVTFENFTNGRFRHPARFVRWRPDKNPADCDYDQVDVPPPLEFQQIFD